MDTLLDPPDGAFLRCLADHDLAMVFADLKAARAADREARCSVPANRTNSGLDSSGVLTALRACVTAFEQHRLPIPPAIRDEIRLRRPGN